MFTSDDEVRPGLACNTGCDRLLSSRTGISGDGAEVQPVHQRGLGTDQASNRSFKLLVPWRFPLALDKVKFEGIVPFDPVRGPAMGRD